MDMRILNRLTALSLRLIFAALSIPLLSAVSPSSANAETIGISLPLSGDAAELGQNFRTGAKLAMESIGSDHELFIVDDGCDPDLGELAASDLKFRNPDIIIGILCNAPAKVIADKFSETPTPILVSGARSVRLIKDREREAWNLWRISPGDDYPVEVAAQSISQMWKETPFAIVDDGTIYGRSFTDTLRGKLDELGIKPQFSDTFRAAQSTQAGLLRRLKRAGVAAAFIASATVEDLFTISKNMKDFEIELELITTEALDVLPYLEEASKVPAGLKVISAPPRQSEELNKLLSEREFKPDRQLLMGYSAIQIAVRALGDTKEKTSENLLNGSFETAIGTINFNIDGSSTYNPYALLEWDGESLRSRESTVETQ